MVLVVGTDTYVSLADCTAYHVARANDAWVDSPSDDAEAALRRATTSIDGRYRGRWPGRPTDGREQTLAWPRIGARDSDGQPIDTDEIPREVVSATCELALRELTSPGSTQPDLERGGQLKRLREKVEGIEREQEWPTSSPVGTTYSVVDDLLSGLLIPLGWLRRA